MRLFIFFLIGVLSWTSATAQLLFKEEASVLGLQDSCGTTYLGNGISFVDYNGDGWDDITFATGNNQNIKFYRNSMSGTLNEDVINIPAINYQTKQVNWVDYDNDGDKDLFVTSNTDGVRLFQNDGSLNFQDVTISSGFPISNMFSYGASWGDINNDGYLDVFISNRDESETKTNKLFQNNGNGTFTDISIAAGVAVSRLSFCAAFFDYNNDGWQDIYVSNDKYPIKNLMYRNNGDGTFVEVGQESETDISIDAMSVTVGDYNSDGWFDMYITNSPGGNVLFKNNGDGTFLDIADTSGTLFESVGWGAVWFDAENDSDLDLYVSGSNDGSYPLFISAAFYKNIGVDTFEIPDDAGFDGDEASSYSNAVGDLNNDGLFEIAVTNNLDDDLFIWNNLTVTSNNWLKVKLEGTVSNRDGIGSVIEIFSNGQQQFRYTLCGEGYLSQNSSSEIFGLGNATNVDYVKVTWLSGIVDHFYDVNPNQLLEITEGSGTLSENTLSINTITHYPNPVINILQIRNNAHFTGFEIYNALGQKVAQKQQSDPIKFIDFDTLSSGIYFVRLMGEGQIVNLKIVKSE